MTSRAWLMLVGLETPPKAKSREELIHRVIWLSKGAAVCHGVAFLFSLFWVFFALAIGGVEAATWFFAFNLALNCYPVMLQRSNRMADPTDAAHQFMKD